MPRTKKVADDVQAEVTPDASTAAADDGQPTDAGTPLVEGNFTGATGTNAVVSLIVDVDCAVHSGTVKLAEGKERAKFIKQALENPAVQEQCPGTTAADLERELVMLLGRLLHHRKNPPPPPQVDLPPPEPGPGPCEISAAELAETPDEITLAAKNLLTSADLMDTISGHLGKAIAGEKSLALLCYLYGVSRLLAKPLNLIVTGASSSGKSFVLESVAKFLPRETKLQATSITENALYYLPQGSLCHRVVLMGERNRDQSDANADRTKSLREMSSAGYLRKVVTARTPDGRLVSEEIFQAGPIALSESTTVNEIFAEDANRAIVIGTDETAAQTIRCNQASNQRDQSDSEDKELDSIFQLHHAMQRMLQPERVIIPYAAAAYDLIKHNISHVVEVRRAWPQCKQVIKSVALLHQLQRERTENGAVVATLADYKTAKLVMGAWLTSIVHGGLPAAARGLFDKLRQLIGKNNQFTMADAKAKRVAGESQLRRWLPELVTAGLVEPVYLENPGRGRPVKRWRVIADEIPLVTDDVLPSLERLEAALAGELVDPETGDIDPSDDELPPGYRVLPDGSVVLGDDQMIEF